jgi:hypothetical protein
MLSATNNISTVSTYLTGNPKISFCRVKHKQHANFMTEHIFYDMVPNIETNVLTLKLFPSVEHNVLFNIDIIEKNKNKIITDDIENVAVYFEDNENKIKYKLHDYDGTTLKIFNDMMNTQHDEIISLPFIDNLFMSIMKKINYHLTIEIKLKKINYQFIVSAKYLKMMNMLEIDLLMTRTHKKFIKRLESKSLIINKNTNMNIKLDQLIDNNGTEQLALIFIKTNIPNFSCNLCHNDMKHINGASYNINKMKSDMIITKIFPHMKNNTNDLYVWDPQCNIETLFEHQLSANQDMSRMNLDISNNIITDDEYTFDIMFVFIDVIVYEMCENTMYSEYLDISTTKKEPPKNPKMYLLESKNKYIDCDLQIEPTIESTFLNIELCMRMEKDISSNINKLKNKNISITI